jgi:hypothetical protein
MFSFLHMGNARGTGQLTRWGRGSCEGYSIHLGYGFGALGGQVVRNAPALATQGRWRASINARELGCFPSREAAMAHVERELRIAMLALVEDWNAFQAPRLTM